jgi:sugar phosphate permease
MKGKLIQSRWYRIIPVVFITYSLAYLDRSNFGFGLAGGMAHDLHITSDRASLLGALFFLGYFFFQVPGLHYAARKSTKKLICLSLILWGLLASATGLISNIKILMLIRFMLGAVEGAVLPALVLMVSRWFTKMERSRANTYLILGNPVTILWMSVVSGYLIHSLGWRWMFIWEGIPAIIWAFFYWNLIEDRPSEVSWLDPRQRAGLNESLKLEQQAIKPVKNYFSAFTSRAVISLCLQYALWSIGVYGFVIWLPSMINKGSGLNIIQTGWLSSIPYFMAIVGMTIVSHFSDKNVKRKIFIWPFLLAGAISFFCSYLIGPTNFWLSFVLLCVAGMAMYAPYGPFFSMITEMLPENVAGAAIALINSFGALGSFAGAYFVGYLNSHTGGYDTSYVFMACSLLLSAILVPLTPSTPSNNEYSAALAN